MPQTAYTHKSMLLRGVKFGPPTLDRADIEATKGKASRSGRSYGGAPLRGNHGNGRGRGGQISYGDSRPNPFAAHINPGFPPQGIPSTYRNGPPPPPTGNWVPPPPGPPTFWRGPPPPQSHGTPPYGHSYPPSRPPQNTVKFDQTRIPPTPPGYQPSNYAHVPDNSRFSSSNQHTPPQNGWHGSQNERYSR